MRVTARQRRALAAICDTFAPGLDGLPSASSLGVADEFLAALERHGTPAQRRELLLLLTLWDTVSPRFSSRPHDRRERVLRAWRDSRSGRRRTAYKVFRKGALTHYFGLPGAPRAALGYPGPLDAGPRAFPFEPERPARDTQLDCDVCVIGSGAGGGTAAGVLAAAGLDVVVLEAGGAAAVYPEELDALRELYLDGATSATADQSVDFLAGSCLGGGTWVNWTTSLRPPEYVREEWAALGVPTDELERSLDAVSVRLDVNDDPQEPSLRDVVLERGLRALGWHVAAQPRNARGCDTGGVCGYCGFGCALGAKRSTVETWLADADAAGARILVGTRAERVVVERGAATAVEARAGETRVRVRARAVVAACGAVHTPALLVRSGLEEREHRAQPAHAPGDARRRRVRRGGAAVGGIAAGALLGRARRPRRRLRRAVRDAACPPGPVRRRPPVGRSAREPRPGPAVCAHRAGLPADTRPRRRPTWQSTAPGSRSCTTGSRRTTSGICGRASPGRPASSRRPARAGSSRRMRDR